jgi:hypothetical protein
VIGQQLGESRNRGAATRRNIFILILADTSTGLGGLCTGPDTDSVAYRLPNSYKSMLMGATQSVLAISPAGIFTT